MLPLSGVNAQRARPIDYAGYWCELPPHRVLVARATATLERCDLSENGAHGLEIQDAKVEDALRFAARNGLGVFVSDPGSSSKLRRAGLSRSRRCGVWVQSGASCGVWMDVLERGARRGAPEDKSSAVLRRCAFAGRDDHRVLQAPRFVRAAGLLAP